MKSLLTNLRSRPVFAVLTRRPSSSQMMFLGILLLEVVFFQFLIITKRMPLGHDGFQYFTLQYYFLNNVVNALEIPQWMPFMTHGTVASWWYCVQAGLWQNVMCMTGALLKGVNFLPIFHIGMFVDELLLLAGTWLLAKRFYSSSCATAFVTISVVGSSVWLLQPWWCFHFFYAIPLILHLLHRFVDECKWRYVLFAGNLFAIQMLGSLPYFFPVAALVICAYFFFFALFNFAEFRKIGKRIRFDPRAAATLTMVCVPILLVYTVYRYGTDQIVNYNVGRSLDGTTTLKDYLTYAGEMRAGQWLEVVLGISPTIDLQLYGGILLAPFVAIGLVSAARTRHIHFVLVTAVLVLLCSGTFVSTVLYYCWPMMKYFRHLTSTSNVVKVFLCFVAGFGVDAMLAAEVGNRRRVVLPGTLVVLSGCMVAASFWIAGLGGNVVGLQKLCRAIVGHPPFMELMNVLTLTTLVSRSAIVYLGGALVFMVAFFARGRKGSVCVAALLLMVHSVDLATYKFSQATLKSVSLEDEHLEITRFQPTPFAWARGATPNSRAAILGKTSGNTTKYWSTQSFLFADELGSDLSTRTDHWLMPLDRLMRALWGQDIDDRAIKTKSMDHGQVLLFPSQSEASRKMAGVTHGKIQFFRKAQVVNDEYRIAEYLRDPEFKGDVLLLSAGDTDAGPHETGIAAPVPVDLQANERLQIPCKISRFDANHLDLAVDVPGEKSVWLLYTDVWHPLWRALVNGKRTEIYRGYLAYKAVRLEPGSNAVELILKSVYISLIQWLIGLNSLAWVISIVALTVRCATVLPDREPRGEEASQP